MRPAELKYRRAVDLSEAGDLLYRVADATPMAGGQGLMRDVRLRRLDVGTLVDLSRIPELSYVREEGDALEIGAVTTLATVASDPTVQRLCPALAVAAGRVADVQIRNRATIAGNLCGSWMPSEWSNDIGVVLAASGGDVLVMSRAGQRTITGRAFVGAESNPLEHGEFIRAVRFPLWESSAYERLSRRWADASIGSAAAFVDRSGAALRVGLAVGRIHARTVALDPVARAIESAGLDSPEVERALDRALAGFSLAHSVQADADYRRSVLPVIVRRAVRAALSGGNR
jgi:carbon-monoxide dehydrogenase medium subunit